MGEPQFARRRKHIRTSARIAQKDVRGRACRRRWTGGRVRDGPGQRPRMAIQDLLQAAGENEERGGHVSAIYLFFFCPLADR